MMPYFRYDDWQCLVTEMKSKRHLVTKRNKTIRRLAKILKECSDYLYEQDLNYDLIYKIDEELKKLTKINLFEKENENVCT